MTAQEFAKINSITIDPEVFLSCDEAIAIMKKTKDVLHGFEHPFAMIDELNKHLSEVLKDTHGEIDFQIILLAICWHDTWRSTRMPTSPIGLLFDQYIGDGPGSAMIFNRTQKKLPLKLRMVVSKIVWRHSLPMRFRKRLCPRIEEKIFNDLDGLEEWSMVRIKRMEEKHIPTITENPHLLRLAKFYFERIMSRRKKDRYNFDWSRKEFEKRKKEVAAEFQRLLKEYAQYA